jgi:hypothetical protein
VIARLEQRGGAGILVAPITHSQPERAGDAIEIPANVRRQLGLDAERYCRSSSDGRLQATKRTE